MTTLHPEVGWTAGDDWQINATLLDENGNPFILGGGTDVLWSLVNAEGKRVIDEDDVSVTIADASLGKCSIHVPAAKTAPLAGGVYRDTIRIIAGGITSTLAHGKIWVSADPWSATEIVAAAPLRAVA